MKGVDNMARVKMEEIVEYLSGEMRRALIDAVMEVSPHSNIDEYELYRAFKRAVRRKCGTWERVPDRYVEIE
jgi:hypothetical protein